MWKFTPPPQSGDRISLTAALKPLAVYGTSISFSALGRQTSKARRPQSGEEGTGAWTPEMKMCVLLGSSPHGKQVLVTWALVVVPSDLSLRDPAMSLDMRLWAASGETAGSDGSEPMAVDLSDPLG